MADKGFTKLTVQIGATIDALKKPLAEATKRISTFSQNTKRSFNDTAIASKKAFKNVANNALWQQSAILAAGMGTVLVGNVRSAVEFESAMADVKKVVDFPTPKAFKEMNRDVLNLSKRIPLTASGIAEIVAAAGQAGIERKELTKFAETASQMAIAFDMTAGEAGEAMAKMRTAMNLNQEEVEALADSMNHLSNNMASSAAEITRFMLRVGAGAKQFAITETQVAAFGSAMIAAGAAPEVAATSFRNLTKALSAGEIATKRQRYAFNELGLDAVEVSEMMQKDATGTIQKVFKALENVDAAKRASITKALFGSEARALAPLITNTELLQNALDEVANAELFKGSMLKEFETRSKTAGNQMLLFRNNLKALSIVLGTTILPTLNAVIGALTPVIGGLAGLIEKFPILGFAITTVAGLFVAFIALLPVLASGVIVFKALAGAAAGLAIFKTISSGLMLLGLAFKGLAMVALPALYSIATAAFTAAAPFLPIIAAVAAVGAALYALWKWRKPILNFFGKVGKVILGVLTRPMNLIKDLIGFMSEVFKMFDWRDVGKSLLMGLWKGLQTIWAKLKNWLSEIVEWIRDLNPFRGWGDSISNAINGLKFWNDNKDETVQKIYTEDDAIPLKKGGGGILGPMPDMSSISGASTENLTSSKNTKVVNNNIQPFTVNVGSGDPQEIAVAVEDAITTALNDASADQRALLTD